MNGCHSSRFSGCRNRIRPIGLLLSLSSKERHDRKRGMTLFFFFQWRHLTWNRGGFPLFFWRKIDHGRFFLFRLFFNTKKGCSPDIHGYTWEGTFTLARKLLIFMNICFESLWQSVSKLLSSLWFFLFFWCKTLDRPPALTLKWEKV